MVYGSYEQVANLGAVVTLFKAVGYCGFWWSINQIDYNFHHWAWYMGHTSKWQIWVQWWHFSRLLVTVDLDGHTSQWQFKVLQYRCYHNTVMTHLEGNTGIGLKVRLKSLFLFTLCLHSNFYTASSKCPFFLWQCPAMGTFPGTLNSFTKMPGKRLYLILSPAKGWK